MGTQLTESQGQEAKEVMPQEVTPSPGELPEWIMVKTFWSAIEGLPPGNWLDCTLHGLHSLSLIRRSPWYQVLLLNDFRSLDYR